MARWKCRTQISPKKWPSAYHRRTLSGYVFATKACIDNHVSTIGLSDRNLLNSNISSICVHNMANFGPLMAEIGWRVWGTPGSQQISMGFASWLCYCSDVVHQRPTKLFTMFGRLLGWYTIYTFFGGFCRWTEFCQVQTSLCLKVLSSPILAALLHGTPAAGVSQTLRRGTRNGITELSQTAPPRPHIRLGGHHVGHRPTF